MKKWDSVLIISVCKIGLLFTGLTSLASSGKFFQQNRQFLSVSDDNGVLPTGRLKMLDHINHHCEPVYTAQFDVYSFVPQSIPD